MKLTDIINEIENNHTGTTNTSGRRDILKTWGAKIAAAAVPFAGITLASKKSEAKTTDILAEAIYLALSITKMQIAFYTQATGYTNLILPPMDGSFKEILKEKKEQEAFWIYYLNATSNPLPAPETYDFNAKGNIPKTFTDLGICLQVAQALEDAGVRIYLTAVNEFWSNQFFRKSAVNMGATNARHAAHVRLRRRNMGVDMMPWVPGTQANSIYGEVVKAYQEEDNIYQWKNNMVGINGFDISFENATEAFDEPVQRLIAAKFMSGFIVTTP
jgi:hypothetical protein